MLLSLTKMLPSATHSKRCAFHETESFLFIFFIWKYMSYNSCLLDLVSWFLQQDPVLNLLGRDRGLDDNHGAIRVLRNESTKHSPRCESGFFTICVKIASLMSFRRTKNKQIIKSGLRSFFRVVSGARGRTPAVRRQDRVSPRARERASVTTEPLNRDPIIAARLLQLHLRLRWATPVPPSLLAEANQSRVWDTQRAHSLGGNSSWGSS